MAENYDNSCILTESAEFRPSRRMQQKKYIPMADIAAKNWDDERDLQELSFSGINGQQAKAELQSWQSNVRAKLVLDMNIHLATVLMNLFIQNAHNASIRRKMMVVVYECGT